MKNFIHFNIKMKIYLLILQRQVIIFKIKHDKKGNLMSSSFNTGLSGSPLLRRTYRQMKKPERVIGIILLGLLIFFVFMPVVNILQTALTFSLTDRRLPQVVLRGIEAIPGAFSFIHFERVFFSDVSVNMFYRPFWHSILVTGGLTVLSMLIGCTLAYLVVRTNLPYKKIIANIAAIPYVIPSWPIALAWLTLFKNQRIGGSMGWIEYLTGFSPPNWLSYGAVPIIICLSLHYYAFSFITVSGALASIDSNLEETGALLGANKRQVMSKITLPLVLPAILSAFILTFSKGLGTFGTPAFLGLPIGFTTLSTQIYSAIRSNLPGDAFVIAMIMILISGVTIYMNVKVIGARKSYVTISGKGFRAKPMDLGKAKWLIFALVVLFAVTCIFLPLYVLLYQTVMEVNGDYSLSNFTLHYWIGAANSIGRNGIILGEGQAGILRNPDIWFTTWNSIRLSLVVSVLAGIIGIFLGYAIVRGRGTKLSSAIDAFSFIPYIIPGIAFGAVYLGMFSKPIGIFPSLYGTFTLLVVVSLAKRLPFSSRTGTAAMMQVDKSLEEAGTLIGAGFWTKFKRIIYPLTKSGFIAGFMLSFISTMRELSLIVLLVTPQTRILPTMTLRYTEGGYHQFGDAIAMLLVFISLVGISIINKYQGKGLVKGIGD